MRIEDFEARATDLIKQGDSLIASAKASEGSSYVDADTLAGFRAASLSFLSNVFSSDHVYYTEFDLKVKDSYTFRVRQGVAILEAARAEVAGGWSRQVRGLLAAEYFSDFLEMSEHLLSEGYKDAAAVILGSALEEHLRQLCVRFGVSPTFVDRSGRNAPKRADTINADLCKVDAYNLLDQKAITSWLDLRNNAAHGNYGAYTAEQVRLTLQAVMDFAVRVPA